MKTDGQTLSTTARALVWLGVEALALGLTAAYLSLGTQLRSFITTNELEIGQRNLAFICILAGAVLPGAIALSLLLLGRVSPTRLESIALRAAPAIVLPLLVTLADWELWQPRRMPFLLGALAFGGCLAWTLSLALAQPPFFAVRPSWARPLRAQLPLWLGKNAAVSSVVIASLAYGAYFSFITIKSHYDGYTSTYDLGIFDNVFWNTTHFNAPLFKCSPLRGPHGGHFSLHATFIAFVLIPIYALIPGAPTLLAIQSILLGLGGIPLYGLAKERIGKGAALVVALCYLAYAPLHGANLYHFHDLTLAPLFVLSVAYAMEKKRPILTAVLFILAVSVREDQGIGLGLLGLFFLLSGERPKAGLLVGAAGLTFSVLMKLVIMPPESGGESFLYMYRGIIPAGDGALGLLKTLLGNPGYLLHKLASEERLLYLLQILVPVLFLPLKRPLTLLLFVNGFAFTLLTGRSEMSNSLSPVSIYFQYTCHWAPYVFLATVLGLERLRQTAAPSFIPAVVALAATSLVTSYQFGAILQHNTAYSAFYPFHFRTTAEDLEHREARKKILAVLPAAAAVAASDCLVPHISSRKNAYNFQGNVFDADYLVSEFSMPCAPNPEALLNVVRGGTFGVVALEPHYVALQRGAPTTRNAELKQMIRAMQRPKHAPAHH